MAETLQAIRGMHDTLPADTPAWSYLEAHCRELAHAYGYQEIRFPIVEQTRLFKRGIGEVTDIVEKEMYTFTDRNGDSLSLRPEGTAACVRAGIQHSLFHGQVQRLWYMGPMFRHERPQRGRCRQFHQFGVEAYGFTSAAIEAEIIAMGWQLWQRLGIDAVTLQINSLGNNESRAAYREQLQQYLRDHIDLLDEDSQQRLEKNPLRVLDSKNPALQELIAAAPSLLDSLDVESKAHFEQLCQALDALGIAYEINPRLVRGLDYYNGTVFEWITDQLGAQGTLCAGGRYDRLVEQIGGKPTPAFGFALGLERVIELLAADALPVAAADIYIVTDSDSAVVDYALQVAETLRDGLPGLSIVVNLEGGNFKKQFKRADKSGAALALVLGGDELAAQQVTLKPLRDQGEQQQLALSDLVTHLREVIDG